MRNKEKWKPTRYILKRDCFRANHNTEHVYVASRLNVDLLADAYSQAIQKYAYGDLADFGCGHVPLYEMYKKRTRSQICIDWSNTAHKNDFLDIECDLNCKLDMSDNIFDTIILSDVLEHIRKPEILLSELYRITRSGGVLIMGVPFYYWLHETPYDYFRYTEYALKSMLEDVGYEVLEIKATGGALDVWGDLTAKILARVSFGGALAAKIVQSLIYFFGMTNLGERIRKGTSPSTPLSYIVIAKKVK